MTAAAEGAAAAAAHGGAHGEGADAGAQHGGAGEPLLFLLTAIAIGALVQQSCRHVRIPYTALLLVVGLVIGILQAVPTTEPFEATLAKWMSIDPHLLLLIFLPTIGFSAAIGQEPHLLRKNWGQILILAWPGVVVTFLLIAVCAKYFFPYGWSWPQALLFGAMLSATDPVAVVAVLHEVGADEKLASVIDGESLVNDGSALVIFLVLQQIAQGATLSAAQIAQSFCQLALLGAAIGLAFAVLTSAWLAVVVNDARLEIVLTFGAAYGCYYCAEELAGASGLLAVVVMGFSMSLLGGRHLTQRVATEMHAFWSALEWVSNTVLFLWVGIVFGIILPPTPSSSLLAVDQSHFLRHLSPADAGWAVVLYFWLIVARAALIAVFFPLLSSGRVGYPMTWRTAAVMVWSGLRGAVGVAMSLFILLDTQLAGDNADEFRVHACFYMVSSAFLTVVVNGSTTKHLLGALGLLRATAAQRRVVDGVLREVNDIRADELARAAAAPDPVLGAPDAAAVAAFTDVRAAERVERVQRRLRRLASLAVVKGGGDDESRGGGGRNGSRGRRRLGGGGSGGVGGGSKGAAAAAAAAGAAAEAAAAADAVRLRRELRVRLLRIVKASYGEQYARFDLGTGEVRLLQEATDRAIDAVAGSGSSRSDDDDGSTAAPVPAAAGGGPSDGVDAEMGAAGVLDDGGGGLADWAALQRELDAPGWAERLSGASACCRSGSGNGNGDAAGGGVLSSPLQVELASKLVLVSAFVQAHADAQALVLEHLAVHAAATAGDGGSVPKQQQQQQQLDRGGSSDQHASPPNGGGGGGGGDDDGDVAAARIVLAESRAESAAAVAYARARLLPRAPGLACMLQSRHVAIQVLQQQHAFLSSIEAAGLVKGEEMHAVQHRIAERLERMRHVHASRLPPSSRAATAAAAAAAGAGAGAGDDAAAAPPTTEGAAAAAAALLRYSAPPVGGPVSASRRPFFSTLPDAARPELLYLRSLRTRTTAAAAAPPQL